MPKALSLLELQFPPFPTNSSLQLWDYRTVEKCCVSIPGLRARESWGTFVKSEEHFVITLKMFVNILDKKNTYKHAIL